MQFVKHFKCTECGRTYPIENPMNLCPHDQRPVRMELDMDAIAKAYPDMAWYRPEFKNMWRFGPVLPIDIGEHPEQVCTLGEGHTPMINISAFSLCTELGLQVWIKDEGQAYPGYGANPTGSFKDRGMVMVTTMAKHFGLTKLAVPTQGNAGDSLSEYATRFGLEAAVVMPDDTPMPIMGKVAAYSHIYPSVQLHLVKGTIREAGAFMKAHLLPQGYFNCATFQEPGWRIEGKKTMGLELAEPWGPDKPDWELPEVVLYPTGGGTGILGMWKAFDELEALGAIDSRRPRIITVQSDQNAPVVDAFEQGLEDTVATDGGETLATGLNVPGGVGQKAVLRILRDSNGGAVAVSEQDIAHFTREIFAHNGMFISPEGAAAVAALKQAKVKGWVSEDDRVVCFNTGHADKYWPQVKSLFYRPQA